MDKTVPTHWVRVYMSGPIEIAKQVLRRHVLHEGLCVTVEPTLFIYTGGEETGYVVGLVHYEHFPCTQSTLWDRARVMAEQLLEETHQLSALVMSPADTLWITRRHTTQRAT